MKDIYQFYFKNDFKEYSINIFTENKRNCLIFRYKNTVPDEINSCRIRIGGILSPAIDKAS
ncbi:MAG: hypothetical protein JW982_00515 [Spirochaetes bacterium]|nr:hypothetical protein [Spirochaetota bacterium]